MAHNLGRGRSRHKSPENRDKSYARSSPEEDSRVSIVGNRVISKGIVDTLSRTKASLMILNLEKFMMIRTLQPLQPMRKSCYSFVNKIE